MDKAFNLLNFDAGQKDNTGVSEEVGQILNGTVDVLNTISQLCDPYTTIHQNRVCQLACAIAGKLNLTAAQTEAIRIAALLHDIGKVAVPNNILSKYGAISDYEFGIIKNHPQNGYKILSKVKFPWPIARIVLQHHERMDGSGYPVGLFGDDIYLEARVIMVADVVEAMSSHRPYRSALGVEQAVSEISKNRGTLYDGLAVTACLRLLLEDNFEFKDKE